MLENLERQGSSKKATFIYRKETEVLNRALFKSLPANLLVAIVLAYVISAHVDLRLLAVWMLATVLISGVRMLQAIGLRAELESDQLELASDTRSNYIAGTSAAGLTWGIGYLLFQADLSLHLHYLFLWSLGGVAAGAYSSMAASRLAYIVYISLMFTPVIGAAIFGFSVISPDFIVLLLLFVAMLIGTHQSLSKVVNAGFLAEYEALVANERYASTVVRQNQINSDAFWQMGIVEQYILMLDLGDNWHIQGMSHAFVNRFHFKRNQLMGKKFADVLAETSKNQAQEIENYLQDNREWNGELELTDANGESVFVHATLSQYKQKGVAVGCKCVFEDLTDKKELQRLTFTDALTNIANRLKLVEVLEQEIERSSRYSTPTSVILCDIDHFKSINDNHGHNVGDDVLVELSKILSNNLRSVDLVGRGRGEEFLIVCPETEIADAVGVAEKLRAKIEHSAFSSGVKVTSSFGVANWVESDTVKDLVGRADKTLYQAKEAGRNRVVS